MENMTYNQFLEIEKSVNKQIVLDNGFSMAKHDPMPCVLYDGVPSVEGTRIRFGVITEEEFRKENERINELKKLSCF